MGRTAWIWMLLVAVLVVVLAIAWIDGGGETLRTIEQPVTVPGRGE